MDKSAPNTRERSRSKHRQTDIDIDTVLNTGIGFCALFIKKGFRSCREDRKCHLLHARGRKLYPSDGLERAKRIARDASLPPILSVPEPLIDPLLGLTSYLLLHKSSLVVQRMFNSHECFVFVFKQCKLPLGVAEIARQRSVRVKMWDRKRLLFASDNVELPELYLHTVKHSNWSSVLDTLVSGFQHAAHTIPCGIYSVDAGRHGEF